MKAWHYCSKNGMITQSNILDWVEQNDRICVKTGSKGKEKIIPAITNTDVYVKTKEELDALLLGRMAKVMQEAAEQAKEILNLVQLLEEDMKDVQNGATELKSRITF